MTKPTNTRRSFLGASAAAAALTLTGAKVVAAEVDPIFALIDAHKGAYAGYWAAMVKYDDSDLPHAARREGHREVQRLMGIQRTTFDALFDCKPATVGGAIALMRHAVQCEVNIGPLEEGYVSDMPADEKWFEPGRAYKPTDPVNNPAARPNGIGFAAAMLEHVADTLDAIHGAARDV